MALAALILSVLAIVIAAISALYAKRQAVASEVVATIEKNRRHDETQPALSAGCDDVNDDLVFLRLWVQVDSGEGVDHLSVSISPKSGVRFSRGQSGVSPDSTEFRAESYDGPLEAGDRAMWRVEVEDEDVLGRPVAITVRSVRGEEKWSHLLSAEFPYDVMTTIG